VLERDPRVPGGENRAIRRRLIQQLLVVRLRGGVALEQQVRMRVDQSRQHRHLRQIDHTRPARLPLNLRDRADRLDPVALDQDADARLRRVRSPVDQAPGLDEERRRGLGGLGCLRPGGRGDGERGEQHETAMHRASFRGEANLPLLRSLSRRAPGRRKNALVRAQGRRHS